MGLSKKLGGTAQKSGPPVALAVPYKWSNQTYTVEEILKKFKLPCVVQCATDSCTVVWSDFQFDLRQPLLFYSKRTVQKVHARSLKQTSEVLEEIGPPLTIPEDYEGWFGAAPKGVSKAKRHFRIEGVANTTAQRFLVTTKCPAFTSSRGTDGSLKHVPHDVMPGEVLKRVCVMESLPEDPDCPDLVKLHGPCLECLDEKGEDVVIPLSYTTLSYEVDETYPDEESRVFQITSPIASGNTKLPRIFTLIHGDPPLLAYAFTGMVRCYSVFTEETILAGTLEDPGSRCLELATDSYVKFRLGLNEAAVKKTCEYTNAFQMCENFGAKFLTGMKVSFTMTPDISNVGDMDETPCESVSDMQDVEANSEFEIAWGSVKEARHFMAPTSLGKSTSGKSNVDIVPGTNVLTGETTHTQHSSFTDDLSGGESEINASVLPQHRDFTEQEIVDLMLRKGMVASSDSATEPPLELDVLKENRVTDNPLFYFFQRNPEQNPWKATEPENDESSSDDSQENDTCTQSQKDLDNPLAYLFQKTPVQSASSPETKNPLSYLFQQHLGHTSTIDKMLPDENLRGPSPFSPPGSNFQKNDLSSESCTDISNYDQVVLKPARVYTGDDDEADDDTEEDDDDEEDEEVEEENESDSSESIEVFSDISEMYDATNDQYYSKGTYVPDCEDKISTSFDLTKNLGQVSSAENNDHTLFNITNSSSVASTDRVVNAASVDLMMGQREEIDLVLESDETEAVDDLLILAARESRRFSNSDVSGNPKSSPTYDRFNFSGTESSKGNPAEGDSAHRLNSLLDEVSEIVNTSSDRILDINKGVLHLDKSSRIPPNGQDKPLINPRLMKSKRIEPTSKQLNEMNKTVTVLTNTHDKASTFVDDNITLTNKSAHKSQWENNDHKSKFDNVFKLNPGLSKLKAGESMNLLRRSHAEVNLAHTDQDQENDNLKTLNKLRPMSPSDSCVSSIFSVVRKQRNDHHHPQSSETDNLPSQLSSPNVLENGEHFQFPYKNQRILSLTRGNVLASVQNLERLNSTRGSSSSNYSSSLDNSFVQGVPKLVVIGDTNLIMGDRHSLTDESGEDIPPIYAHRHQKSVIYQQDCSSVENSAAETFRVNEHYVVSKIGKLKPGRLSQSQNAFLQIPNDCLQEDYV